MELLMAGIETPTNRIFYWKICCGWKPNNIWTETLFYIPARQSYDLRCRHEWINVNLTCWYLKTVLMLVCKAGTIFFQSYSPHALTTVNKKSWCSSQFNLNKSTLCEMFTLAVNTRAPTRHGVLLDFKKWKWPETQRISQNSKVVFHFKSCARA